MSIEQVPAHTKAPLRLFWLSFADDNGFRGAALVQGASLGDAVRRATALGINPGGEVLGPEYPPDAAQYDVALANMNRLMKKPELDRLFTGEARPLRTGDYDFRIPASDIVREGTS